MKRKSTLAAFLAGAAAMLLVVTLAVPALAALAQKTIQVATGVNVYVDDAPLLMTDAAGNPVEAFIYNGSTYLPVRAVSQAVGTTIQWDGPTQSVYIGKHSSSSPAVYLQDLDYFTGIDLGIFKDQKDNLGNTHTVSFHGDRYSDFDNTYLINGAYTRMTGTLFLAYDRRSTKDTYSVEIYGDGALLFRGTVTGGVAPVDFDVDLTGVLQLRVVFDAGYGCAMLTDVGLWS